MAVHTVPLNGAAAPVSAGDVSRLHGEGLMVQTSSMAHLVLAP